MSFIFEKLEVYQKALDFAERITDITRGLPKGNSYISDQLNRASLSISLNIAEGNGRFHKADRRNFFVIARGSIHECIPLLEIMRRKSLIDNNTHINMKVELEVLAKMLSGLIKGLD